MTELVLDALAAWRVARLVTQDEITADLRERFIGWTLDGQHRRLRYLAQCSHCVGVWAALAMILLRGAGRPGRAVRDVLAVAGGASLLVDVLAES